MTLKKDSLALPATGRSLIIKLSEKYQVEPGRFLETLKSTAFRQREGIIITNEHLAMLMIVADQYDLNPFTGELFAFPDKNKGIIPIVSVDGWSKIINRNPAMIGMEFENAYEMTPLENSAGEPMINDRGEAILWKRPLPFVKIEGARDCPPWMEVTFYRKDREIPIRIREYIDEVYRPPFPKQDKAGKTYLINGPWQTHTKRMHRHKVLVQGGRVAFGYVGIYDQDEADRIINATATVIEPPALTSGEEFSYSSIFNEALQGQGIDPQDQDLLAYLKETADFARGTVESIINDFGKTFQESPDQIKTFVDTFRARLTALKQTADGKKQTKGKTKVKGGVLQEEPVQSAELGQTGVPGQPGEPGMPSTENQTAETQEDIEAANAKRLDEERIRANEYVANIRPDLRSFIYEAMSAWSNTQIMGYMLGTHKITNPGKMTNSQINEVWQHVELIKAKGEQSENSK